MSISSPSPSLPVPATCTSVGAGAPGEGPGEVALLLAEMERANAALPAGTQEVHLGQLGCIVEAVVDALPGCLGLQNQVAGIITTTCARGAQRGEQAPGSVLEVAAATEAGWEVELAALGFQFGWHPGPAWPACFLPARPLLGPPPPPSIPLRLPVAEVPPAQPIPRLGRPPAIGAPSAQPISPGI